MMLEAARAKPRYSDSLIAWRLIARFAARRTRRSAHGDFFDVLLRHDPGCARRRGAVEGHEIGPWLLEPDAHALRIDDVHAGHARLQRRRAAAAVPLERELHVLRGHGLAVVELDALAKDELIGEAVLRHAPRLGEARRHRLPGQRLHDRVV